MTATDQFQTVNSLNLDLNQGPTDFDRRHNLVLSGRGDYFLPLVLAGGLAAVEV